MADGLAPEGDLQLYLAGDSDYKKRQAPIGQEEEACRYALNILNNL